MDETIIHLTKTPGWVDGNTLCGLKKYRVNASGITILLTFPVTIKNEYGVCKNCERVRDSKKHT